MSMTIPSVVDARHSSDRYQVDRSDLGDDMVEEIAIPILFGLDYDEIYPDFGDDRDGGDRTHEGEDMMAPEGTPIVSPTEAIVTSVGFGDSAGNYVYTANPGGETFRYMHMKDIADIKRGDKLERGDFIGTVGDTGNAAEGSYHLHFEMRDSKNEPMDPYLRLTDTFTLKEKMSFLENILDGVSDEDEYALFLVETFPTEFKEALRKGYSLPKEIEEALEDNGVYSEQKLKDQLDTLIASIPSFVKAPLDKGNQGASVSLLQIYLIYSLEGVERDQLLAAGPTGYYGSITASAVSALQKKHKLPTTGVYDTTTRTELIKK